VRRASSASACRNPFGDDHGFVTRSEFNLRFDRLEELLNSRFNKMDERLNKMDERLDKMDERLDKLEVRLDKMDKRLNKMDERISKDARKAAASFNSIRLQLAQMSVGMGSNFEKFNAAWVRHNLN
jgi:chromosome segregation ATPase